LEALTQTAVAPLLALFPRQHVVVVGDVMLDEYVRGDVARISPEAPVPVVDLTERQMMPGGAANAAANIISLGATATIVGVVGADAQAEYLRSAMSERGIGTSGLVTASDRSTTHKLRIVARTQQIVRVDVETRAPISAETDEHLVTQIRAAAATAQAIVISDYAKGVVTARVIAACIEAAHAAGIPLVVDPKGRDFSRYAGATIITPNVLELEVAAGVATHNDTDAIDAAARSLMPGLKGTQILVTRGARGMTLLAPDAEPLHLPTVARSVYDVTGAGDTVVGTLTLALAAKLPILQALLLATHAASIAVGRPGTVAVTTKELLESFDAAG
jgi:D-beta-D-heptose 7-phosphate kinase/D-beta-D-heptose 1-phosphate adenosyltransferase